MVSPDVGWHIIRWMDVSHIKPSQGAFSGNPPVSLPPYPWLVSLKKTPTPKEPFNRNARQNRVGIPAKGKLHRLDGCCLASPVKADWIFFAKGIPAKGRNGVVCQSLGAVDPPAKSFMKLFAG